MALYPYLAESFHDARFSRSATYDLIRIESEETDSVVIEIVERNLDYLIENMPVYPAPTREMPVVVAQMPDIAVSAEQGKTEASSKLMLLQAEIPSDYIQSITKAFFACDDMCYEAEILYPGGSLPVASAWVPAGEAGNVSVIYGSDGSYCSSAAA